MERQRVLVVDDEPEIRGMLKDALEEMGYECATAHESDAAFQMISALPIDLVLLDVMMPGRSGADIFRQLIDTNPTLAVIFITARVDLDLAVETMRSGAYDYLVKPVGLHRLQQAVERALQKRQALLERDSRQQALEKEVTEQGKLLENSTRQLEALNRLMQGHIKEGLELEEATGKLAQAARYTAELLAGLADAALARLGSRGDGRVHREDTDRLKP